MNRVLRPVTDKTTREKKIFLVLTHSQKGDFLHHPIVGIKFLVSLFWGQFRGSVYVFYNCLVPHKSYGRGTSIFGRNYSNRLLPVVTLFFGAVCLWCSTPDLFGQTWSKLIRLSSRRSTHEPNPIVNRLVFLRQRRVVGVVGGTKGRDLLVWESPEERRQTACLPF